MRCCTAVLFAGVLALATQAAAQVAPYADWRFQLRRAGKDAAQVRAVAEQSEAFTRAWFYGHIFDLSIPGIAKKEKQRIRARAEIFAEVLANAEPPDLRPALLMEVPLEVLRADFDAMETVLNAAITSDRAVDRVAQTLSDVPHAGIVHAAFYALLHRADVANPRLGGRYDAGRRLEAARGLAEALAFADGDLAPWRALAAYRGAKQVVPVQPTIPESRICEALNQIASDTPAAGRATVLDARRALSDAAATPLRLLLIGLGPALIAERGGDHAGARGALSAGGRSGAAWMRHVLVRRALAAAVRAQDPAGARALAANLDTITKPMRPDPRDDAVIKTAVALWTTTGDAHVAAGRLDRAAEEFAAASRWTQWLRQPERLAGTVPAARQQAAKEARSAIAGEVALADGRLSARLGRETAATQAFRASRGLFLDAQQPVRAAVAELALAEALLLAGDLDQSLARAIDGIKAVQPEPREAARGLTLRALIRLRRGELAPAFANANAALEVIRAAQLKAPKARVEAHILAAAALDADGQHTAARDRLVFARQIDDTLAAGLAHATLLAEAGDLAGALTAIEPHVLAPKAAVSAGCLEARAGRHGPAAARLAPLLDSMGPDLDLQVRARACLAVAWTALGQRRKAQALLLPPATIRAADPGEAWALLAAVSAAGGAQVTVLRQAATNMWRRARGDGHLRTLLDRRPQAFADIGPIIEAATADDLARRTPTWKFSLPRTIWWIATRRALTSAAPRPDADLPGDVLRALRGPLLRAMAQRAVLADAAISDEQRAAAMEARATAWAAATGAADVALAKAPRWAAYAAPLPVAPPALAPPAGTARLYLQTSAARSRAWLYRPGAKAPIAAELPGRDALASLRAGVEGHLTGATVFPESGVDPHRQAWTQLADAARTLAPQLVRKPAATAVHRVEVIGDGPLAFFPWSALVLEPPTRSGPAPVFLGQRWAVVHRLGLGARVPDALAPPALAMACADPCPAAVDTLSQRVAARGGQIDRQSSVVTNRAALQVHGASGGDALTIGATAHTRTAVARLGAKPFALALSGEVDGARGAWLNAWTHAGAHTIAFPVGHGPAPFDAMLLEAWSRAIGKAPVDELVFSRTARGGALTRQASLGTSAGASLADALLAARRARAGQSARPGATPAHHPSQWARWLIVQP